jgi:Domain of unknown function (DUF1841)
MRGVKDYDPLQAPPPQQWLATDEEERFHLVIDYHHAARVKLPNHRLHAAIHVIVENQVAMGDELPARRVLDRLQAQGLDRHDAIHAIGAVLTKHLYEALSTRTATADDHAAYWAGLERLTAKRWRRGRF